MYQQTSNYCGGVFLCSAQRPIFPTFIRVQDSGRCVFVCFFVCFCLFFPESNFLQESNNLWVTLAMSWVLISLVFFVVLCSEITSIVHKNSRRKALFGCGHMWRRIRPLGTCVGSDCCDCCDGTVDWLWLLYPYGGSWQNCWGLVMAKEQTLTVLVASFGQLLPTAPATTHNILHLITTQRCKKWQMRQIYMCYFFSAGANFWAILGHFWAISAMFGDFWANLGNFGSFLGYFG